MPSVLSDFSLDFKKMHPEIGTATDYSSESLLNVGKGNIYRRQITVNNSSRTPKTNYTVAFIIDHRAWYLANKTAFTFCDLRVLDSDGVTPLPFYVEAPNTSYTTIFVRFASLAAASRTVYIEYGNPSLPNQADLAAACGAALAKSTKFAHFKSNTTLRETNGGPKDNFGVQWWPGTTKIDNVPIQTNLSKVPSLIYNQLNGQPIVRVTGSHTLSQLLDWRFQQLASLTQISVFIVARATTLQNYQRIFSYQNGQYFIYPYWNGTSLVAAHQFDGGTTGISSGLVANTWNLGSVHWQKNIATTGFRTYRNGGLVAQRTSANADLPQNQRLDLFSFGDVSEYTNADIGDIIAFSDALTTTERQQVESYLNAKFRIYNTADIPAITVGAETTIADGYTHLSLAPFSSFSTSSKSEEGVFGVAETSGTATITNMLNKTLAVGNSVESWSSSTLDRTGKLTSVESRTASINSTTTFTDSVTIERLQGGNNLADLSKFDYSNLVDSTITSYASTAADWVTVELFCENANTINTSTSFIRLYNSVLTSYAQALFSTNINGLRSNQINTLKFPKSAFTFVGSTNWQTLSHTFQIGLRTTSGTQQVWYGSVKLEKNYQADPTLQTGNPVRLRNLVSSDQDATYYPATVTEGRISTQMIESTDVKVEVSDYVSLLSRVKFSDLDSFPSRFVIFDLYDEVSGTVELQYYTYVAKKILGFVFPHTYLDIDLDLPAGTNLISGSPAYMPQFQFFTITGDQTVGEVLGALLRACLGVISYDSVSGKITARTGISTWDPVNIPTPHPIGWVYEYKSDASSTDYIYNYVEADALLPRRNNSLSYNPLASIGIGGLSIPIRPTIGASDRVTLFFPLSSLIQGAYSSLVTNQIFVAGYQTYVDQLDPGSFNTTNVRIVGFNLIADQIAVSFQNTNTSTRYLAAISFGADYLRWDYIDNIGGSVESKFVGLVENKDSSRKFGQKPLEIDPRQSFVMVDFNTESAQLGGFYSTFVDKFKGQSNMTQVDVQYDPHLRIGKVVTIRDKDGRNISGHIIDLQTYSQGGEYVQTVTVRAI